MVTALEFLTEFAKELLKADPMDRHPITLGFVSLMKSREMAIRIEEIQNRRDAIKYKLDQSRNVTIDFLFTPEDKKIHDAEVVGHNTRMEAEIRELDDRLVQLKEHALIKSKE